MRIISGFPISTSAYLGQLVAHLLDDAVVLVGVALVAAAEDAGAGHEGVGTRRGDLGDVVHLHAPVDLQADVAAGSLDTLTRLLELLQRRGNEALTAEAGVHRHDEDHVDLVHDVVEVVQRRGRVEHQACLASLAVDQLQAAVDVLGGLGMEGDVAGAGLGEVADDAVHRLHHQVHVDDRVDAVLAQSIAHQGTDGEVGHIVIVHHVEMDEITPGCKDIVTLLPQLCEVCGEDGRRQYEIGHNRELPAGRSGLRENGQVEGRATDPCQSGIVRVKRYMLPDSAAVFTR